MTKIAIVGAPSTGKTVLARRLVNTLSLAGYDADAATEYARTYLFRYVKPRRRRRQDLLDQVMIYLGQKRREEDLAHCDCVVCDSATFLPFVWAGFWGFDLGDPREVMVVQKLFKWSLEDLPSYSFLFHVPPALDYRPRRKKGWKISGADERLDVARRIESYLQNARVPYHTIDAPTPEEREKLVIAVLSAKLPGFARPRASRRRRGG